MDKVVDKVVDTFFISGRGMLYVYIHSSRRASSNDISMN